MALSMLHTGDGCCSNFLLDVNESDKGSYEKKSLRHDATARGLNQK